MLQFLNLKLTSFIKISVLSYLTQQHIDSENFNIKILL